MKRGKQSTTTLQAIKARQTGRHMKQPDTQREGPAQKLGQDAARDQPKGEGNNSQRGREPPTAQQRTKTRKPHNTEGGTQRPKRRQPQNRRQKRQQYKTQHRGATAREEPKRRPKTNRGQGKHGPKQAKSGVQEGDRTTKTRAKRPPPRSSKWEQVTKRCQGTIGTEDQTGVKRTRKSRGEEKKGRGVATSYSV